jgi:cytochrome P450
MREIMRNTAVFSNVESQEVSRMRAPPPEVVEITKSSLREYEILVASDPPKHKRVRKMLDPPFRPRAIDGWRDQILEIINNEIDKFDAASELKVASEFEAVSEFAVPVPITVIADILGIDRKHSATIKAWSDASVEPLGMMISDERWIECARLTREFQNFMIKEFTDRQTEPRDDLLTHMVQVKDPDGEGMSLPEMLGSVQQLLVASNETTTNGIAAGIQLLAENPKQQTLLRDNPNRMYTFVNETLRLESPVQGLFRVVKVDTEVNGIKVPQGSRIMLRYAAANRDAQKYQDPYELDVFRANAGTQVGFGAGIHHCIGANLAREEMFQSFTELLRRTRNIRLKPGMNDFSHHPSLILRGLKTLHIEFDRRPTREGQTLIPDKPPYWSVSDHQGARSLRLLILPMVLRPRSSTHSKERGHL